MKCNVCLSVVSECEVYTTFYYCITCKKTYTTKTPLLNGKSFMPTRAKQCKTDLHVQAERLSEKDRKVYDSPTHSTKGMDFNRNV